jgi:hypothetical protein
LEARIVAHARSTLLHSSGPDSRSGGSRVVERPLSVPIFFETLVGFRVHIMKIITLSSQTCRLAYVSELQTVHGFYYQHSVQVCTYLSTTVELYRPLLRQWFVVQSSLVRCSTTRLTSCTAFASPWRLLHFCSLSSPFSIQVDPSLLCAQTDQINMSDRREVSRGVNILVLGECCRPTTR